MCRDIFIGAEKVADDMLVFIGHKIYDNKGNDEILILLEQIKVKLETISLDASRNYL